MKVVFNQRLINYLIEKGEQPIVDKDYCAYFNDTENFRRIRQLFDIEYMLIRNRL